VAIIEVIILGIVQGLTEFIPVSSSGHLVLFQEVLGVSEAGLLFDVALHVGTLLALLIFFKKDILEIAHGFFAKKQKETYLVFYLTIATLPAVVAGLLLQDLAATTFRSPSLVAVTLGFFGVIMLLAETYASKRQKIEHATAVSFRQALIIGGSQAFAIVPGVSRSGVTISAGLFAGLSRVAAARFSFLLAIPVIFGASVKVLLNDGAISQVAAAPLSFGLGFMAALISGLFAIRFLLNFVAKRSIAAFAYYRFVVAAVVLIFLLR